MDSHGAFKGGKAKHSLLYSEYGAAAAFGIDPDVYFQKPRENRIAITAWFFGNQALKAMQDYDHAKEIEAKSRKPKGGK